MGYHRAGFDEIVGVDIKPQPNYPFEFVQGDAIEYCREHGHEFDVIHASPPCQAFTPINYLWKRDYPDLIELTRDVLKTTGKPYIIENVRNAPLNGHLMLCGTMFDLRVIRHRYFENNFDLIMSPFTCRCNGLVGTKGHFGDREYMTVTGHFSNIEKARQAMGIDWMTQGELAQAIPPAYTEFIGKRLLEVVHE